MLSLFRVVTLEDWTDVMYINMYGCDQYGYGPLDPCTDPHAAPVMAALFFVSFVMLGTMIVLNLFIGVIMTGMDEAQKELNSLDRAGDGRLSRLAGIADQLEKLQEEVHALASELKDSSKP